ncbi:hypothetical protein ACH41E_29700 [Streptomyces sp. NPDC020412]|uniref:hypothetical protein n=1 Tax=Streptomyces sp. NPDC020412 TaxID=3365073 RepID=UPI0037B35F35
MPPGEHAPLIVPLAVDALLDNNTTTEISRSQPAFSALAGHGPAEPGDTRTEEDDDKGVYVQWELPTALRTGRSGPGPGHGIFPPIPNRWLILAHSFQTHPADESKAPPPRVRAWLLRGDTPADEDDFQAAPLPGHPDDGGYPVTTRYGTLYPLDGTASPPAEPGTPPFLTVDSTGLPAFCQYQPHHHNVLSFHDTRAGLKAVQPDGGANEITVSYLVVGWHSTPAADPVPRTGAADLPRLLAALGWTLPTGTVPEPVQGTLYVGTALGVIWQQDIDIAKYPVRGQVSVNLDGRPLAPAVRRAVAHSAVEATTTLIAQTEHLDERETALFEAFEYNLLDTAAKPALPDHTSEPLTDHALDYARHDATFTSRPGGHRWQLAARTPPTPDTGPPPAPTAAEIKALDALNAAQATHEACTRRLADLTTRLKGLWWITSPYNPSEPTPPDQATTALMRALADRVHACREERDKAAALIPAGTTPDQLATALARWEHDHAIGPGLALRPTPLPAFRQPADPVVLLQGLRDPARTPELDGYLGGPLTVRLTAQLNTTSQPLKLPEAAETLVKNTTLVPAPVSDRLTALTGEFARLLDTVLSVQRQRRRDTATDTQLTALLPHVPHTRWWHQPWRPLFLHWTAELYPTPHDHYAYGFGDTPLGKKIPQYHHKKNVAVDLHQDDPRIRTVTGTTFLLPLIESHTRYRLLHAESIDPGDTTLTQLRQKIGANAWDLLSFTLSGIGAALAGRRSDIALRSRSADAPTSSDDLTYAPPASDAQGYFTPAQDILAAHVPHLPRDVSTDGLLITAQEDRAARGDGTFPPARSAQIRLTELFVTDSFGRTLTIKGKDDPNAETMADSVTVGPDTRSFQGDHAPSAAALTEQRPRLHQGARLRFDHQDTATGLPLADLPAAGTGNPVHGWFLTTRLGQRQSLLCYAQDGTALFDLHCLAHGPGHARPLPGSPYTSPRASNFSHDYPQLAAFLTPLLAPENSTAHGGLAALLDSLDRALAAISPPPARGPDGRILPLLMGRPLALTTALLRLELDGPPLPEPTIAALGSPTPIPPPKTGWPVRLGDPLLTGDGLLGYFTADDYSRFHTDHPADSTADPAQYTRPAHLTDLTLTACDPTQPSPAPTRVHLLTCPHSPVHATSDVLPAVALHLPTTVTDRTLAAIRPAVALGPVLAPTASDTLTLTMPLPALTTPHHQWTWAQTGPDHTWTTHPLTPPQPTDQAPGPIPEARTGYLRLTPTP